jgi:hypothetical protein
VAAEISAWAAAVILALFGVMLVFAAWGEGWPFWLGFGLISPLGLLALASGTGQPDGETVGSFAGGGGGGGDGGGDFAGGDFGGGGGDGGG